MTVGQVLLLKREDLDLVPDMHIKAGCNGPCL